MPVPRGADGMMMGMGMGFGGVRAWSPLAVPAAFAAVWTPTFDVQSRGAVGAKTYRTSLDWNSLKPAETGTVYVDAAATGAGTGLSWTDAFTTVLAAVQHVKANPTKTFIRIKAGTYTDDWNYPPTFLSQTCAFIAHDGVVAWVGTGGAGPTLVGAASVYYFEGITFDNCTTTNAFTVGQSLQTTFVNCTFRNGVANGLGIGQTTDVYLYGCTAHDNADDGLNYTSCTHVLEEACIAYDNGTGNTDNASTCHTAGTAIIRVGGKFYSTTGPVVADVDDGVSWLVGCYAHDPAGTTSSDTVCYLSQRTGMWLTDCRAFGGWGAFANEAGKTLYYDNACTLYSVSGVIARTDAAVTDEQWLYNYIFNAGGWWWDGVTSSDASVKDPLLLREDPAQVPIRCVVPRVAAGRFAKDRHEQKNTTKQGSQVVSSAGRSAVHVQTDDLYASSLAASAFRCLHDGTGGTWMFAIELDSVGNAYFGGTGGINATSTTGQHVQWTAAGAVYFGVTNGSGTAVVLANTANGVMQAGTPIVVATRLRAANFEAWINGVRVVNTVPVGTPAPGDSTFNLRWGGYGGGGSNFSGDVLGQLLLPAYPTDDDFHSVARKFAARVGGTWT